MILRMFDIPIKFQIESPYIKAIDTTIYDVAQVHSFKFMEENLYR